MASQRNGPVLSPTHGLIAVVVNILICIAQVGRAEECITCRTERCGQKVGIEAWCGRGLDPLKKKIRPTHVRPLSKPTGPLPAAEHCEKPTEPNPALESNSKVNDSGTGATETQPPLDSTPSDPAATSRDPADATVPSPSALSVWPSITLPALASTVQNLARSETFVLRPRFVPGELASTVQNLARSENHALQRSRNKWIVVGLAAGAGLTIAVTVFVVVLGNLPPRCGPPAGTVSLNRCNDSQ